MRFRLALPSLAVALLVAGCGGGDDEATTTTIVRTTTETATSSVPDEAPAVVTLYFLRDGKVAPVQRGIVTGPAIGSATIRELLKGPSSDEEGVETAIPSGASLESLAIGNGVASLRLSRPLPSQAALAQIVYTLTQFPTVKRVSVGGKTAGRKAFEAQTPAILIESPAAGDTVQSGFEVTGTANTFEATFNYELKDAAGKVIAKNFVTATSGSGTRGTFRFTVPYKISKPQQGTLVAFEVSAADGSRTHTVEVPLRLQ
jgi:immunoglobulin-like protein involved in spore germination/sporulation and spore germination protein